MQPEAAILWRKIRIFLPCRVGHRILCLSMFGLSTRCVRNPQTMSGLSGAPSGTASQSILNRVNRNSLPSAIENKADGSSDIGFARLCFVHWCQQGAHTKVLKLSADYEHTLWNVQNLEKHRSSRMFDAAWLEIPDFTIRIAVPGCIWNAIVSFSYRKTYPI